MREFQIRGNNLEFTILVKEEAMETYPSLSHIKSGNKSDLSSKLNGVHTLLKNERSILDYFELCGGVGFSSALVYNMYSPYLFINDINEHCLNSAILNLPKSAKFTNIDYLFFKELPITEQVVFLDFSNFTLNKKKLPELLKFYINKPETVLITDVFSFSLKPWDGKKYQEYLERFQKHLQKTNKYLHTVYLYRRKNAAIFLLKDHSVKEIRIIKEYQSNFYIYEKLGLFKTS